MVFHLLPGASSRNQSGVEPPHSYVPFCQVTSIFLSSITGPRQSPIRTRGGIRGSFHLFASGRITLQNESDTIVTKCETIASGFFKALGENSIFISIQKCFRRKQIKSAIRSAGQGRSPKDRNPDEGGMETLDRGEGELKLLPPKASRSLRCGKAAMPHDDRKTTHYRHDHALAVLLVASTRFEPLPPVSVVTDHRPRRLV